MGPLTTNGRPPEITIRHKLRPGDIGYVTYLHGTLYAAEYRWDNTFEAYVAGPLAEFSNYRMIESGSGSSRRPDRSRARLRSSKLQRMKLNCAGFFFIRTCGVK